MNPDIRRPWLVENSYSDTDMGAGSLHEYRGGRHDALNLHVFSTVEPSGGGERRPGIVFFFGGGWHTGGPNQFLHHAKYFAARRMVAICAEYRVSSRYEGITPLDCVSDAFAAMRWVREHAETLGVDPDRIVASGGSAGGHLALCVAMLDHAPDDGPGSSISARPDALVLFNPAVHPGDERWAARWPHVGDRFRSISPLHCVKPGMPPSVVFHGTEDAAFPIQMMRDWRDRHVLAGNECELVEFEGREHGFFNHDRKGGVDYRATVRVSDQFLQRLGFISPTR